MKYYKYKKKKNSKPLRDSLPESSLAHKKHR